MTMKKVKPLGNRVLIERCKAETSKGGILLPDSAKEKPKEGIVVAVGPGKYNDQGKQEAMNVKIGDRVLFSSYAGTEVKNTGCDSCDSEYMILAEDDILGILVSA